MNDAGGVEVLDAAEHLVEQVGHPLVVQVHLDHLTQVGVHQLHHQVPATTATRGKVTQAALSLATTSAVHKPHRYGQQKYRNREVLEHRRAKAE